MKANELFVMTSEELKVKLDSLKQELFNLRFKHATGQLENANELNTIKKDIARIKTILRQRELNISSEPVAKKTAKKAK